MRTAHASEAGVGAVLAATPIWEPILSHVNVWLSTISMVLGIVVGLHVIWDTWRRKP